MQRCLELALNGLGSVAPNPMVGSVIVAGGEIIGEGFHQKYGGAHAEVNAIESVKDKKLLSKSALYVNLEPCAHFGKTPSCADLIIHHKIPKVIIGCRDTFHEVAGRGIEKLQAAGCEVTTGVLEQESRNLNRRFFTFHEKKRPYVILKWAQTLDGFLAPPPSLRNYWITNDFSRTLVHKWRTEEQAIMIGTNTVLTDNPRLTARLAAGKNPLRVVPDKNLRLSKDLNIFDGSAPTLVFTEKKMPAHEQIQYITVPFHKKLPHRMLEELFNRNIQSVIIEGGARLLTDFINEELWDEARVFIGSKTFGSGLKAPVMNSSPASSENILNDKLIIYINS